MENEEAIIETIKETLDELRNWPSGYVKIIDGQEVPVDEIYRRKFVDLGLDLGQPY